MKLTRTAALILALAMVFALAGCGADKAEPIDTAALAGSSWKPRASASR